MRRRDFLRVLCGAGALWPVSPGAQQTKMHRGAFVAYAIPVSEVIGVNPIMKLTRFRGHPRICVEGVHDAKQGKEASTIPA